MSNIVAYRIYGCPAYTCREHYLYSEENSVFRDIDFSDTGLQKIGFHSQYDQSETLYWWGQLDWDADWGLNNWPKDVKDSVKAEVNEAWLKLPEEIRALLGTPKTMLLVPYD